MRFHPLIRYFFKIEKNKFGEQIYNVKLELKQRNSLQNHFISEENVCRITQEGRRLQAGYHIQQLNGTIFNLPTICYLQKKI